MVYPVNPGGCFLSFCRKRFAENGGAEKGEEHAKGARLRGAGAGGVEAKADQKGEDG